MTQIVFSLALALLVFWMSMGFIYPALFGQSEHRMSEMSLEEAVREIKLELAEVGNAPGDTAGLVLTEAKAEFAVIADEEREATGTLKIPVFSEASFGSGETMKEAASSKIKVAFASLAGGELLSNGAESRFDLSDLVLAARSALLATRDEGADLTPKSVVIELAFVLVDTEKSSGGIKAEVVSVGASRSVSNSVTNMITLSYQNPSIPRDRKADEAPVPPR